MAHADLERAAAILVDLELIGDAGKVAAKWGVTSRTLRNYQARVAVDSELSAIFRRKSKAALETDWAAGLSRALGAHIEKHRQVAESFHVPEDGYVDPEQHAALTESTRVLGELAMGLEVLRDAADGEQGRGVKA